MKLYRHYKQKFYKYLGTARHSESEEEFVLYECLYPNAQGQTWVRPKAMFHEEIENDGRRQARFAPVEPEIMASRQVGPAERATIAELMRTAFGEWDENWFDATFQFHSDYYLLIARLEGRSVGFKLGYRKEKEVFHSWLGGVHPEFRGFGIATELLKRQHQWCREQGFKAIETHTQNRFKAMLILNLKQGFEMTGTHINGAGHLSLQLRKQLE